MLSGACRRSVAFSCVCLIVLTLILAGSSQAAAQVLYGSVLGDVKDTTGASVPGANVVVTNKGTGLKREAVTDTTGHYNLPDLPAGVYGLKITMQGFKSFEQTEVTVNINSVTRIDVPLEVGAMTDTVTVNAEPPKLQTDSAEVHETLVAADLTNLPVPLGRNYQQVYRCFPALLPLLIPIPSRPILRGRWSSASMGRATTRTTPASTA